MAALAARAGRVAGGGGAVPSRRLVGRLPGVALAVIALAGVTATGVLQVMQASRAASSGYEIGRLEDQRARLNAEIRLLEVEVASMSHSDRVRQQATDRLAMVPPDRSVRVSIGVPAPRGVPLPGRYVQDVEVVGPLQRPWWAKLLESLPVVH
jgi:cell division protein FtsL